MATGGIELSLLNLLNTLKPEQYDIDLVLYYPKGEFLDKIPSWVHVFPIWENMNHYLFWKNLMLSRNFINRIIKNVLVNSFTLPIFIPKKSYDVGIAFSGYHIFCNNLIAKANCKKKLIWVHADFSQQYQLDSSFRKKFKKISSSYSYFDSIVCVSETACEKLKKLIPQFSNKITYCWNIITKREYPNIQENFNICQRI